MWKDLKTVKKEQAGMPRLMNYLSKVYDEIEVIKDKNLQKYGHIDAIATLNGQKVLLEFKIITDDHPAIFAEHKAVKNGYTSPGWMTAPCPLYEKHRAYLYYSMRSKLIVLDLHKLREWYDAVIDKTQWREHPHWDKDLKQMMYAHLIPWKELKPFIIAERNW